MPLEIHSLLHNRYRIEATIASGGMGAVYRAFDETLGIAVAVKENFFSNEEFSRQFRREATILASLRHPNLPRVTDHFTIPGQGQYLVMDFIEGVDLREVIAKQGALPEAEVVRIGALICRALDYLHGRNPVIVHRDIKPGNLKITPSGQVFLVDFGLAKVSLGEATTTGAQALTPGYAPPEQYGQGTTPLSDIYALGATLYAALSGKIPEDGLSRAMGSAELTPIRKHNPKVSERLARMIERSMAVQPGERYPSANAFLEALEGKSIPAQTASIPPAPPIPPAVLVTPPSASVPMPAIPKRKSAPSVVLAVAGVLALTGLAALVFGQRILLAVLPAAQPITQSPSSLTAAPTLASTDTRAPLPTSTTAPSPTALPTRTEMPTQPPTATSTNLPEISQATATQAITATSTGGGPGQIAFSSDRSGTAQIWLMNSDGSGLKQITNIPDGACQPDWSPDGTRLVFISPCAGWQEEYPGASLYIINADTTGLVPLSSMPGGDFDPAWSPDGSQIAFTSLRENVARVFVYNLADNSVRRLSNPVNRERRPAWSPDGALLAYETTRLGQPQIWIMEASGEHAREFSVLASGIHYMPAWSPDASVIVYGQGSQPLLIARQVGDAQAKEFPISQRIRPVHNARFSSDGWWIAFDSKQEDNLDIYRMQQNGSGMKRLTDSPGQDFHPAWRPR